MSELHHVLALTKLHIKQHYESSEWIFTDPETFKYFQAFAQTNKPTSPTHSPTQTLAVSSPKMKPINRTTPPKQKIKLKVNKTTSSSSVPLPIQREKLKPADPLEFSDFREILQKHFPNLELLASQPDDTKAQEQALLWRKENCPPEIIFLHGELSSSEHLFLQNLTRAIDAVLFPSALIPFDKFDESNSYQLVIGSKTHLRDCKSPHLEIDPIDHYLHNPLSKAKLWQDLKNTLLSS